MSRLAIDGRIEGPADNSEPAPEPGDALAIRVATVLRAREPITKAWDIQIEEVRRGYSRLRMLVRDDMLNGHATVHGGVIFTLADTAFAYACNSTNVVTMAAQASIIFLSAAYPNEVLVADAWELGSVARSGAYAVHVRTTDGRAVAEFQGFSRTAGGAVVDQVSGGD